MARVKSNKNSAKKSRLTWAFNWSLTKPSRLFFFFFLATSTIKLPVNSCLKWQQRQQICCLYIFIYINIFLLSHSLSVFLLAGSSRGGALPKPWLGAYKPRAGPTRIFLGPSHGLFESMSQIYIPNINQDIQVNYSLFSIMIRKRE